MQLLELNLHVQQHAIYIIVLTIELTTCFRATLRDLPRTRKTHANTYSNAKHAH